jgi:hypothetical protein
MIITPFQWSIISSPDRNSPLLFNEPYEIHLYSCCQQEQFCFYGQVKCFYSGYTITLNSRWENRPVSLKRIPITIMLWYDTNLSFKPYRSYILLLEHENEVEPEKDPAIFSALLR